MIKTYGFIDWVRRKMGEWTKSLFQNKELMKFKVYLHEMEPCIFLLLFMCGKNNENEIYFMITCYETLMRVTNISTQTKISFYCKKKISNLGFLSLDDASFQLRFLKNNRINKHTTVFNC